MSVYGHIFNTPGFDKCAHTACEPFVDHTSHGDPKVVFSHDGAEYEACQFDAVGAVCIVYAADGSFVYNDTLENTERFLRGLGCPAVQVDVIMQLLRDNPAKD